MISEAELRELSFPDAPKMLTQVPGPKVAALMQESAKYEAFTRGGADFPVVLEQGKGATAIDVDGNLYIDMAAGVAVNAVGRGHPRVLEAIRRQSSAIMHTMDVTNPKRIELAKKVSQIMPEGLRGNCHTSVFQAGSDAVETAIKFARRYTGRSQIIAFQGAYHGVWCGTAALTTGHDYRHGWGPLIAGVTHAPYAYCYRCAFGMTYPVCEMQCAKYIDYILNTPYTGMDDVAAVIVESEQGEGGYVAPPPEFFQIVKTACEKNGCLYIADEVQSGAGRTGKMWCIEYADVVPDILTWGKGMGGDLPMAGITYRADMEERLSPGSQPSTFAGNALSCEVCMTNIDLITDPKMDLMGRAVDLGEEIKARLTEGMCVAKCIGEIRGRGLMIGCEVVADRETKEPLDGAKVEEIAMRLLRNGVLMTPCGRNGNVFRFMPPLTIPRDYALKATDIMIDILKDY